MNTGKCPHCGAILSAVVLEPVDINPGLGFSAPIYRGVSYHCPSCYVVLSVSIDPVALKTDTVADVAKRIQQG